MRALIHTVGKPSVFDTERQRQLQCEPVSAQALMSAAALLGTNDQLPILLAFEGEPDFNLLRELRQSGFRGPLIVFASRWDPEVVADYLYAGADDVICAPAREREVVARIDAIARRVHGITSDHVRMGDLTFYFDGRHPEISGQQIRLSAREYAILRHLAMNRGRVVTKTAIYDSLYALCAMPPFDKIIEVYICRLRAKFANASSERRDYIETVPGRGYRLLENASLALAT